MKRLDCAVPKADKNWNFFFPLDRPMKEYNETKLIFIEAHPWALGDTYSTNQALGYMQIKIFLKY